MKKHDFIQMVEKAIYALYRQGHACRKEGDGCVYTDGQGSCCIVGHMMPDEETRIAADSIHGGPNGSTIEGLHQIDFPWTMQFDSDQRLILSRLQTIHDDDAYVLWHRDGVYDRMVTELSYYKEATNDTASA